MKQNRPNQPADRDSSAAQPQRTNRNQKRGPLPLLARILISVLVIWHVTAVFLAPMSVSVSTDQSVVTALAQRPPMQWYLDALYLNHGYHFFAPDPGAGHLIRYQVYDDRGGVIQQGEFPSKKDQWPRLRYHRYFMLADQCELPMPNEALAKQWERTYLTNYARQLLAEYGGASVRVQRIVHFPLFREDALGNPPMGKNPMKLDDPRTYKTELEVTQRRQDLGTAPPVQNGAWNNSMRRDVASGWQGTVR